MKYEKGSFVVVPNKEVLFGLEPYVQAVYFWVCNYSNEQGECFPSRTTLAKCAGCSVKSVDRAFEVLHSKGILSKRVRKDGLKNLTNIYQLMIVERDLDGYSDCETLPSDCETLGVGTEGRTELYLGGTQSTEPLPAPEDGRRGTTPTFGGEEGIESAPRAPRPVKTPVTTIIEIWNKYPNWKATGNKATPKNPSVIKELLPPAKDVKALNGAILKKRSKYSEEDFDNAIRQYASEVANRNKDAKGYYLHRFTLYEFLTHHDIFERYVTR